MAEQYFIKRGETVKGPFSIEKLQALKKAKKLKADDGVSQSAEGPWGRLGAVYNRILNQDNIDDYEEAGDDDAHLISHETNEEIVISGTNGGGPTVSPPLSPSYKSKKQSSRKLPLIIVACVLGCFLLCGGVVFGVIAFVGMGWFFDRAPVRAARMVQSKMQSKGNLSAIAIAFHNYHDVYKTFPAATQIGPKGIPHSWRVTILPFIEEGNLYNEYRQDEPWDSENNKRLLAMIPDIYRCPLDRTDSTNSSYFTYTGSGTLFEDERPRLMNITDGTSHTILAVESQETIPWTKPQDLPFDPAKPVTRPRNWYPAGFVLAMCDGSARFLTDEVDEQTLRNAIMCSDGNVVRFPAEKAPSSKAN